MLHSAIFNVLLCSQVNLHFSRVNYPQYYESCEHALHYLTHFAKVSYLGTCNHLKRSSHVKLSEMKIVLNLHLQLSVQGHKLTLPQGTDYWGAAWRLRGKREMAQKYKGKRKWQTNLNRRSKWLWLWKREKMANQEGTGKMSEKQSKNVKKIERKLWKIRAKSRISIDI